MWMEMDWMLVSIVLPQFALILKNHVCMFVIRTTIPSENWQCKVVHSVHCYQVNFFVNKGEVSTFANVGLNGPFSIVMNHADKTFFVTNCNSNIILKITSSGVIIYQSKISKIFISSGATSIFAGSGQRGSEDGAGTTASFSCPVCIAIYQQTGNLFVNDNSTHIVRKITAQGDLYFILF